MKRLARLAVVVVAVLLFSVSLQAAVSPTTWRLNIKTDDGAGGEPGSVAQLGVATNATDSMDPAPGLDRQSNILYDISETTRWTVFDMGDSLTYGNDIRSTASPYSYPNGKIWNLRTGALPNTSDAPLRLQVVTTTALPSPVDSAGKPYRFEIVMIDNKGKLGAPSDGTVWNVPIPTAIPSNTVFWSIDTAPDINGHVWGNMPLIRLSDNTHAAMLSEGYQMQFRMVPVPEPSSLLALGAGIMGLAGIIRRRRA